MDAVLRFVEAGLGVAVLPTMVLEDRPRLRRIPFARPGLTRQIALAHRRDVEPPATARAFQSMLSQHLERAARSRTLPQGIEIIRPPS